MARKILSELKWHPDKALGNAEITYVHRGAPDDTRTIFGRDIIRLERSFFVLEIEGEETRIPYHRIKRIKFEDKIIWEKPL